MNRSLNVIMPSKLDLETLLNSLPNSEFKYIPLVSRFEGQNEQLNGQTTILVIRLANWNEVVEWKNFSIEYLLLN